MPATPYSVQLLDMADHMVQLVKAIHYQEIGRNPEAIISEAHTAYLQGALHVRQAFMSYIHRPTADVDDVIREQQEWDRGILLCDGFRQMVMAWRLSGFPGGDDSHFLVQAGALVSRMRRVVRQHYGLPVQTDTVAHHPGRALS
ncbi:MAG: hypothetical protein AAGF20_00830 [Pseudomonadota bacterium]